MPNYGFNLSNWQMPKNPQELESLAAVEPSGPLLSPWEMPKLDLAPSQEALQAQSASRAATAGAIGAGIQTAANFVDPKGVGAGSVLGNAAGMAGTGAAVGGPVGAVIGGTLGLGLGLIGQKIKLGAQDDEAKQKALMASANETKKGADALGSIRFRFGSGNR